MLELNETKKALFTIGVGAFGKMSELIKNTDYLPQKPGYFFKLLKMAYSVNIKPSEMTEEIGKDAATVAAVLKIPAIEQNYKNVNKNDVVNAINKLEKDFIQSSLEIDLAKKYHNAVAERLESTDLQESWRLSIRAAIIAKAIAKWVNYKDAEQAFFAALLADIPSIVLSINDPESQEKIQDKVEKGLSSVEAEMVVLGFDHREFGAKLFKYFSVPSSVIDVVQSGYNSEKVKTQNVQLTKIANFAKFLAKCFSDKTQSPSSIWTDSQASIEGLGLKLSTEEWGNKISLLFVKSLEFEMSVTH